MLYNVSIEGYCGWDDQKIPALSLSPLPPRYVNKVFRWMILSSSINRNLNWIILWNKNTCSLNVIWCTVKSESASIREWAEVIHVKHDKIKFFFAVTSLWNPNRFPSVYTPHSLLSYLFLNVLSSGQTTYFEYHWPQFYTYKLNSWTELFNFGKMSKIWIFSKNITIQNIAIIVILYSRVTLNVKIVVPNCHKCNVTSLPFKAIKR